MSLLTPSVLRFMLFAVISDLSAGHGRNPDQEFAIQVFHLRDQMGNLFTNWFRKVRIHFPRSETSKNNETKLHRLSNHVFEDLDSRDLLSRDTPQPCTNVYIRMYFFNYNKISYFGTWVFGNFHNYFRRREVLRIVSTGKSVFY